LQIIYCLLFQAARSSISDKNRPTLHPVVHLSLLLRFEPEMMIQPSHLAASQDSVPVSVNTGRELMPADSTSQASDTITVCIRSSIADINSQDSTGILTTLYSSHHDDFPFLFTERNRISDEQATTNLKSHLKPGNELPPPLLHNDWIILVIFVATILFSLIRKSSVNFVAELEKFFLFRGIGEPSSKDIGALFNWDSTIKNLLSFLSLGLFGYIAATHYDVLPPVLPPLVSWLLIVLIIIAAVTLRHITCILAAFISDSRDTFNEYIISIYQFYRFSAFFILILTVLVIYTRLLPEEICFMGGLAAIGAMYLFRVLRLLFIFLNRGISLFYLILYLCALEILPVIISIKYISGLI